ncbi:MAG: hypothetical protein IIY16_04910, partial [Oscillospiraceae bacterium]|nr:hypothetical protein [Oscillospiraceae bacterium]
MLFLLLTGELPFGPLNTQNDLVLYINRGKKGEWNKNALRNSPFYNAINGCLIPNFRQRLQSVDDVIKLLPAYCTDNFSYQQNRSNHQNIQGYLLRIMQGEEYGKTYDLTQMLQH